MRLRVIDIETTGIDPAEHAVCELGWSDVVALGRDLAGAPVDWQVAGTFESLLVHPGRPIPPETSAIHHIIDEDVETSPSWKAAAQSLLSDQVVEAFVAHSAKVERSYLDELAPDHAWICTYKCALRLWPDAPSHSNQSLRYWRRPAGLDRAIANVAHRAGPDAYVTAFHVRDMLAEVPLETLIQWSSEPALQVRCHIGKWRGRLWTEVDEGFLHWVAQRDFDGDVLFTVRHEIDRRREEWERDHPPSEIPEDDYVAF